MASCSAIPVVDDLIGIRTDKGYLLDVLDIQRKKTLVLELDDGLGGYLLGEFSSFR